MMRPIQSQLKNLSRLFFARLCELLAYGPHIAWVLTSNPLPRAHFKDQPLVQSWQAPQLHVLRAISSTMCASSPMPHALGMLPLSLSL